MSKRRRNKTFTNSKTEAFLKAVENENIKEVKLLLRSGEVDIDARHEALADTALLIACEKQNVKLAKILVTTKSGKANVNLENLKGIRPVWWAAKYGNGELARVLLVDSQQQVEVNFLDPQSGCTPLYRGILSNSVEVCRELIHAGADVNLRRLGLAALAESPLMKAVQLDNLEICELLVNSLCNIHAKTEDGFTALHYAVSYRRYEITEFLLQNRVKCMAKSNKGITAMTTAIEQHNAVMCRILIEYGYKMDSKFKWGESPLEMAIRFHSEECAMTLVQWGCKLAREKGTPSFFYMAANEGLTALLKLLIEINPYYLNEKWLYQKEVPLALYKQPTFYKWLFEAATMPRSLASLCKAKIFQSLGKYPCSKVEKLPIPEKLKYQINHKHHFYDGMYTKKTIFTEECPYDCASSCLKLQCPVLDFESSDGEFYTEI